MDLSQGQERVSLYFRKGALETPPPRLCFGNSKLAVMVLPSWAALAPQKPQVTDYPSQASTSVLPVPASH